MFGNNADSGGVLSNLIAKQEEQKEQENYKRLEATVLSQSIENPGKTFTAKGKYGSIEAKNGIIIKKTITDGENTITEDNSSYFKDIEETGKPNVTKDAERDIQALSTLDDPEELSKQLLGESKFNNNTLVSEQDEQGNKYIKNRDTNSILTKNEIAKILQLKYGADILQFNDAQSILAKFPDSETTTPKTWFGLGGGEAIPNYNDRQNVDSRIPNRGMNYSPISTTTNPDIPKYPNIPKIPTTNIKQTPTMQTRDLVGYVDEKGNKYKRI